MMIFVCNHCKREYKRQPSQAPVTRYCSNKCRAAAQRRPEIRCKGCRTLFIPTRDAQVYCTPTCRRANFGKTRMHRVTKRCLRCGKIMDVRWSRRHRTNYCSIKCRSDARKIKRRPNPEQLRHLVVYMTYEQIARQYNVCACTVMNWSKEYGIKSPVKKKPLCSPKHPRITGYIGEAYGV